MTTAIKIYANRVTTLATGVGEIAVVLGGVEVGNVVHEFSLDEVLECFELSDIHDWVGKKLKENDEE